MQYLSNTAWDLLVYGNGESASRNTNVVIGGSEIPWHLPTIRSGDRQRYLNSCRQRENEDSLSARQLDSYYSPLWPQARGGRHVSRRREARRDVEDAHVSTSVPEGDADLNDENDSHHLEQINETDESHGREC